MSPMHAEYTVLAMHALIIREPWISLILTGEKVWEIRSRATRIRGRIGLIASGSGQVVGTIDLTDCLALHPSDLVQTTPLHCITDLSHPPLPYPHPYAWVLANPHRFLVPKPYRHAQGAVVWVKLPDDFAKLR